MLYLPNSHDLLLPTCLLFMACLSFFLLRKCNFLSNNFTVSLVPWQSSLVLYLSREPTRPISTNTSSIPFTEVKQAIDFFLVLDVEATCEELHEGFDYPNEIIEFPICLMRWKHQSERCELEIVDEFTTFVRPSWRPQLSPFCMELTGITQDQVNRAPQFKQVLRNVKKWMAGHGLIDPDSGSPLCRFVWCSDGPFDIRDFVAKQLFISQLPTPVWIKGDILDVRKMVRASCNPKDLPGGRLIPGPLNIPAQLRVLGLAPFKGRQHRGIDDCRNICRILAELAKRGIPLHANTRVHFNKRWPWMGRSGKILEDRIA